MAVYIDVDAMSALDEGAVTSTCIDDKQTVCTEGTSSRTPWQQASISSVRRAECGAGVTGKTSLKSGRNEISPYDDDHNVLWTNVVRVDEFIERDAVLSSTSKKSGVGHRRSASPHDSLLSDTESVRTDKIRKRRRRRKQDVDGPTYKLSYNRRDDEIPSTGVVFDRSPRRFSRKIRYDEVDSDDDFPDTDRESPNSDQDGHNTDQEHDQDSEGDSVSPPSSDKERIQTTKCSRADSVSPPSSDKERIQTTKCSRADSVSPPSVDKGRMQTSKFSRECSPLNAEASKICQNNASYSIYSKSMDQLLEDKDRLDDEIRRRRKLEKSAVSRNNMLKPQGSSHRKRPRGPDRKKIGEGTVGCIAPGCDKAYHARGNMLHHYRNKHA